MARWRFTLVGGEDSDLLHTYGTVEAETDNDAFAKGYDKFVPGGEDAMEEAERIWPEVEDFGPQDEWDEDEGPFFTVDEVLDDEVDQYGDDELYDDE